MKERSGTSVSSHFAIVRTLIQDNNFLLCKPLLVDLCIACFGPIWVKLFIIDHAKSAEDLMLLERSLI